MAVQTEVRFAELTTIGVGGTARECSIPESIAGYREALRLACGRSPFILGGGSNTFFPDGLFERPVICTSRLRRLEIEGNHVFAEAGVRLDSLIRSTIAAGLAGLEGLVGIPGTAGGATVMNAGGAGGEFGSRLAELGVLPLDGGDLVTLRGADVPWGYRSWNLPGLAVAWVRLELAPGKPELLRARAREFFLKKSRAQPLAHPSSGCVFKNPPGTPAGRLIESLGLKGLSRGGASVSERHGNFIVNAHRTATATDVLDLIEAVRARVHAASGVWLDTEVVFAGGTLGPRGPGGPGAGRVSNGLSLEPPGSPAAGARRSAEAR